MFTPSTPDNCILVADLDNIEVCVLAWFLHKIMGDSSMMEVVNSGQSVHTANSQRWGIARSTCKTILFLLIYGGSHKLIHKRGLTKTLKEAEALFKQVDKETPSINKLKRRVWQRIEERGYLSNPFHAHMLYPELKDKRGYIRGRGERMSFNCLIQRTARDVMHLLAYPTYQLCQKYGARLLLLVHDECVVEAPKSVAEELRHELNLLWNNRYDILDGVRVNGDWNIGDSWFTAK